jgi:ribosomal-protein-alanine N-acetyltransferase
MSDDQAVTAAMRIVEGPAVRLEPQVAAHAEEIFEVLRDPALYEYENEPPESLEWLRARLARLESRASGDGTEGWLNWVIRLPSSELIGYVQATIHPPHRASIAYILHSRYWGRGLATAAVEMMIEELGTAYGVETLAAVLKRANLRSRRLLERLGFVPGSAALAEELGVEADELLFVRAARAPSRAGNSMGVAP